MYIYIYIYICLDINGKILFENFRLVFDIKMVMKPNTTLQRIGVFFKKNEILHLLFQIQFKI